MSADIARLTGLYMSLIHARLVDDRYVTKEILK